MPGNDKPVATPYITYTTQEIFMMKPLFTNVSLFLDNPNDIVALKKVCKAFNNYLKERDLNIHLFRLPYVMRYTKNLFDMFNKKQTSFTKFLDQSVEQYYVNPRKEFQSARNRNDMCTDIGCRNFMSGIATRLLLYSVIFSVGILLMILGSHRGDFALIYGGGFPLMLISIMWIFFNSMLGATRGGFFRFSFFFNFQSDEEPHFLEKLANLVAFGPISLCHSSISEPYLYLENSNREKKFKQANIDPDERMRKNIFSMICTLLPWLEDAQKRLVKNEIVFVDEKDQKNTIDSLGNLIDTLKDYRQLLTLNKLPKKTELVLDENTPLLPSLKEEDIGVEETLQPLNTIKKLITLQTANKKIQTEVNTQFQNASTKLMELGFFKEKKEEGEKEQNLALKFF